MILNRFLVMAVSLSLTRPQEGGCVRDMRPCSVEKARLLSSGGVCDRNSTDELRGTYKGPVHWPNFVVVVISSQKRQSLVSQLQGVDERLDQTQLRSNLLTGLTFAIKTVT